MSQDFTAMPLLAGRLRLQQACPFWRALGIELMEWGGGRAVTRMPPSPRIAASVDDPRIDPLALVGMLDDAFSNAFASIVPVGVGMSTLDLRMGFASSAPPEGAVVAETRATMLDGHSATAEVQARDATGKIVATGTCMFTLGGYPGGSLPDFTAIGNYDPSPAEGPFGRLIGLSGSPGELAIGGGNPNVVGWETGNALHGGVVGALVMAACMDRAVLEGEIAAGKRLASLYIRYLRPGSALLPLYATSRVDRPGRAASYLVASCFHEAGKEVASGHATFVAADAA